MSGAVITFGVPAPLNYNTRRRQQRASETEEMNEKNQERRVQQLLERKDRETKTERSQIWLFEVNKKKKAAESYKKESQQEISFPQWPELAT